MRDLNRTTVDRLDRPSAYYVGKVFSHPVRCMPATLTDSQNKKRRYSYDEGDRHDNPLDTLANATTLYVGNLYANWALQILTPANGRSSFYTTEEQIHELFAK